MGCDVLLTIQASKSPLTGTSNARVHSSIGEQVALPDWDANLQWIDVQFQHHLQIRTLFLRCCYYSSLPHPSLLEIMGAIIPLLSYVLFLASLPFISALKFDVAAHHGHESAKYERCIRNFVAKDQLVVVTANVDGSRNDGQQLNMHVRNNLSIT